MTLGQVVTAIVRMYEEDQFSDEEPINIKKGVADASNTSEIAGKLDSFSSEDLNANISKYPVSQGSDATLIERNDHMQSSRRKHQHNVNKKLEKTLRAVFSEYTDVSHDIDIIEVARLALRSVADTTTRIVREDERSKLQSMENSDGA